MLMYRTMKRIYKKSYNAETETYNENLLTKAVAKGWITEEEKTSIIQEVAEEGE